MHGLRITPSGVYARARSWNPRHHNSRRTRATTAGSDHIRGPPFRYRAQLGVAPTVISTSPTARQLPVPRSRPPHSQAVVGNARQGPRPVHLPTDRGGERRPGLRGDAKRPHRSSARTRYLSDWSDTQRRPTSCSTRRAARPCPSSGGTRPDSQRTGPQEPRYGAAACSTRREAPRRWGTPRPPRPAVRGGPRPRGGSRGDI